MIHGMRTDLKTMCTMCVCAMQLSFGPALALSVNMSVLEHNSPNMQTA